MNKNLVVYSLVACLALSACATKRYDRLQSVSGAEAKSYTCEDIEIELAKVAEARKQMSETAQIDGASVLGFLGDFGIGNAMEKNAAEKTVNKREADLRDLKAQKDC